MNLPGRRLWRDHRTVVVVCLVAGLTACGGIQPAETVVTGPTVTSPATLDSTAVSSSTAALPKDPSVTGPGPRPAPSSQPPSVWATVRIEGEELLAELSGPDQPPRILMRQPTSDPDGITSVGVNDVSLTDHYVGIATCCEPAIGRIDFVEVTTGAIHHQAQGTYLDELGGLSATVDGVGVAYWSTLSPETGYPESIYLPFEGSQDVAVLEGESVSLVVLRRNVGAQSIVVWSEHTSTELALPDGGWCGVIGLGSGAIGLLVDSRTSPYCESSLELWVLDTKSLVEGGGLEGALKLGFDGGAVVANSDSSGTYVAFVTPSGAVRWVSVDGRSGTLEDAAAYLGVDW